MHQDKPPREPSMKLPHVVMLSIIGMLVTSLSVLAFTSPRQVLQNDLTSNECEPLELTSASPKTTPKFDSVTTTPSIAPSASGSAQPRTLPSHLQSMPPELREFLGSAEPQPILHLISDTESCTFYVDAKQVGVGGRLITGARIGSHVVQCHRSNGNVFMKTIDVVEGRINTVTF